MLILAITGITLAVCVFFFMDVLYSCDHCYHEENDKKECCYCGKTMYKVFSHYEYTDIPKGHGKLRGKKHEVYKWSRWYPNSGM